MKWLLVISALLNWTAIRSQHLNILVSDENSPDEPCIVIDPLDPQRLVAGANLNNVYYSTDGGYTWNADILTDPVNGVWGDPAIACDTNGDFYFFHLSNPVDGIWIDRIVCQKSSDGGDTWSAGTHMGLNLPKQQDKEWPAIDRSNNNIYVTWTEFDEYGSPDPQDSSRILFSMSADQGLSWSTAMSINQYDGDCIDSDNTAEGATPAIGPNGEIYVAWSNLSTLYFDRSTDQGQTWLNEDIVIDEQPGGWDYSVSGIYRCNGLPVTCCDTSGGNFNGNIYVNWTDQRNGETNPDVFVAVSNDGGNSWSDARKVNSDTGNTEQFFTWMTVDQVTGYVWFVFYDRRNYAENSNETDVYMAVSYDGCETFHDFKVSETPFIPNANIFFGDYTNVTAYNDVVRPIWTRLHQGQKSIWTAIVDTGIISVEEHGLTAFSVDPPYPNPVDSDAYVSFRLHGDANITIRITDLSGQVVATPLENKKFGYGKYTIPILDSLELAPGSYFVELTGEKMKVTRKILIVH